MVQRYLFTVQYVVSFNPFWLIMVPFFLCSGFVELVYRIIVWSYAFDSSNPVYLYTFSPFYTITSLWLFHLLLIYLVAASTLTYSVVVITWFRDF